MPNLSQYYPAFVVFLGALIAAAGVFWSSYRQSNFNAALQKKNEEIQRLTIENANVITGGDSFAEITLSIDTQTWSGNATPFVINKGKYPLYDVEFRIVDVDELQKAVTQEALIGRTFNIGNLTAGMALNASTIVLRHPDGRDYNYNIFFAARNGVWMQQLRMKWIENGWATAVRIEKDHEEVLREVTDKYPRNELGEVEWERKPPKPVKP